MSLEKDKETCTCDTPTGSEYRRCRYCREQILKNVKEIIDRLNRKPILNKKKK